MHSNLSSNINLKSNCNLEIYIYIISGIWNQTAWETTGIKAVVFFNLHKKLWNFSLSQMFQKSEEDNIIIIDQC